jgi:hypothetical protein
MRLDLDNLPSDMALLHDLLRDMAAVVEHRDGEIERLQTIIKQLQRTQFGRRSERLDPDQPSVWKISIATSGAPKRAIRREPSRSPTSGHGASRWPIICLAKRS